MSTPTVQEPETPAEWRRAVNVAAALLFIDAAKQYGLITGGPQVERPRCEELLRRGKAQGIAPNVVDVSAIVDVLIEGPDGD